MNEIEKYYNGEIIVDFEEETELEKKYNEVAELYSEAVKKKIEYRKEIERLKNQLQQKENIIKEVREYIENHSITNIEWWITRQPKIECKFMKDTNPQELLEILDKGE